MLPTGSTLLDSGESEFTYKRIGASNPTGGFHGREKFTEISFFTDGNLLNDITTEFEMRGCETFTYIQKSIIYRDCCCFLMQSIFNINIIISVNNT